MRFRIWHILVAITVLAVALVVFEPEPPSFLVDWFPSLKRTRIVVAGVDLDHGARIKAENLVLKYWPGRSVPEGAMTDIEDAVDREVVVTTMRGEPVLAGKLTDKGMRAFTISAPTVGSALAGMLSPGSQVDVLLTVSRGRGSGGVGGTTSTLLQHVEILEVDPTGMGKGRIQSVTLHVAPDEATRLTQAQRVGTLSLSQRSWDKSKKQRKLRKDTEKPRPWEDARPWIIPLATAPGEKETRARTNPKGEASAEI